MQAAKSKASIMYVTYFLAIWCPLDSNFIKLWTFFLLENWIIFPEIDKKWKQNIWSKTVVSKAKAWEIQAKDSTEAKAEPARQKNQKTKTFNQGMITDHLVYFTGREGICLKMFVWLFKFQKIIQKGALGDES